MPVLPNKGNHKNVIGESPTVSCSGHRNGGANQRDKLQTAHALSNNFSLGSIPILFSQTSRDQAYSFSRVHVGTHYFCVANFVISSLPRVRNR